MVRNLLFFLILLKFHFGFSQNDLCSGAIALTPNTSCVGTTGSFNGSGNSGTNTTCFSSALQDVWYSFVATDPTMSITLTNNNSINLGMEILIGSCTGASFACDNSSSSVLSEFYQNNMFTVGQTYYVRVFHAESNPQTASFSICVQNYPTPSNDLCADAISLTPNTNCNTTTGSFSGSGNSGTTTSCAATALQDVWYRFVATDPTMSVSLSNVNSANLGMEIITGSCTGTTFVCDNSSSSVLSEFYQNNTFTVGQTYYVRVFHVESTLQNINFTICVQNYPTPSNDVCSGAISLTPNTNCNTTTGSFSGSGNTGTTTSCAATALQDVWYQFVATDPTMSITLSNNNSINMAMEIYSGSCSGTSFACDNSSSSVLSENYQNNTFITGETYYVRVFHVESNLQTANFTICVQNPTLSLADTKVSTIKIFPNPTNDFFDIDTIAVIKEVKLFTLEGQLIVTENQKRIAVSNLPKGIYLVKIEDENGNTTVKKLIKE